jgi:single-strand DNA-binding protein
MSLQLTGTIKLIGDVQTFDSGFKKVEFVLTTNDEKYPQDVKFDISQDKVDDFLKYNKVGASVDVSFNVRGNEYKDKYYVNLSAWKVFKSDANKPATDIGVPVEELATDDLPF